MKLSLSSLSAAAVVAVALAGCGASGHHAAQSPATMSSRTGSVPAAAKTGTSSFTNWPSYHRTDSRSGSARAGLATPLHHEWSRRLDGAVYGEPIVVNGLVIAATENDTVYGLRAGSGQVVWQRHLGSPAPQSSLPCGDIDPLGITGTPAYDSTTGSVFVVAETTGGNHTLWSLNAKTGGRRWHRSLDVEHSRDRKAEQERSALLVTDHRVITIFGGLEGDCSNYVGYVTSVPASGHGKTRSYAVPTAREAGMWSPAGPVVGHNGNVYVSSGNGAEVGGRWDKSDSVTELTPASMHRVAVFAPSTWAEDNRQDLDLGSSSPVPVNGRIVIAGKRGTVYLLRPSLGGVGHQVAAISGCRAFGGAAHYGHVAFMPCKGESAVRALHVGKSSLRWTWSASGIYGSPVVAGSRVYVADLNSGDLKVLSRSTGQVLASIGVGSFTHFPSLSLSGGLAFVPTTSGVTAIS